MEGHYWKRRGAWVVHNAFTLLEMKFSYFVMLPFVWHRFPSTRSLPLTCAE